MSKTRKMMRLVFASNNDHKLAEVRAIMPEGIEVLSLSDIGFDREIEETGVTLEENSGIKAAAVRAFIDERLAISELGIDGVFADDTGLEIDTLGGKPGVFTARWAGDPAANRKKALRELDGKTDRGAQFRTVVTLIALNDRMIASLNDRMIQVEGIVRGRIAEKESGEGGFGYDPLFVPEGFEKTFAELPAEVKNAISHRGRALQKLVELINI